MINNLKSVLKMGTSNFYKENATDYFVVTGYETQYKCSECEEIQFEKNATCCPDATMEEQQVDLERYQWEERKEDAHSYISDEIVKLNKRNSVYSKPPKAIDDRNFYASGIVTVERSLSYNNEGFYRIYDVNIYVNVYLRSAYYQGANFDWDYEIVFGNDSSDEMEGIWEHIKYDLENSYYAIPSLAESYAHRIEKRIQKELDGLTADVETLLAKLSDEVLGVSARFSNGETWYSRKAS